MPLHISLRLARESAERLDNLLHGDWCVYKPKDLGEAIIRQQHQDYIYVLFHSL